MRHAVSQRSWVKCIHVVSGFFCNRMNTVDQSDGKFLVTLLSQRERNPG
jgi:hypothetical protein